MKKQLVALWLVVVLVSAAFTGGTSLAVLSDSEQAQVTIEVAGNGAITITAGNSAPVQNTGSSTTGSSGGPGIDYVAFVSEDSDPGVSWNVESRNDAGEPVTIWWQTDPGKSVDYVVVGYEYEGDDKVNVYDYTDSSRSGAQATSLGSADPDRTLADVKSQDVPDALGVSEVRDKANSLTGSNVGEDATTLRIAYDADNDAFTGEVAGEGSHSIPGAVDDSYETTEGQTLSVESESLGVLGNDSANGATPSIPLASGPSNGTVTLYENGTFTYEPNSGFTGTDSFTYRLSDGLAADTATVNVTVAASQ
jgi:hypothetical protein